MVEVSKIKPGVKVKVNSILIPEYNRYPYVTITDMPGVTVGMYGVEFPDGVISKIWYHEIESIVETDKELTDIEDIWNRR